MNLNRTTSKDLESHLVAKLPEIKERQKTAEALMETSTVSITNQFPSTASPMFQSWCDAKQIQVLTFMKT